MFKKNELKEDDMIYLNDCILVNNHGHLDDLCADELKK